MTKEECIAACIDLIDNDRKRLIARCEWLINSGAIDMDRYPSKSYALPKVILTAVYEDAAFWYRPQRMDHLADLENLRNF